MLLVTGATGLNGRMVIREFARHNEPVRALVRFRAKAQFIETLPGIEVIEGDMARPDTLGAALDDVTRTLMISSSAPEMADTQCTFIEACKSAGVRHIVKFSGAESGIGFDATQFRFTRMHEEIERALERSGLTWTHLRPSQFMQVYLREAPTIKAHNAMLLALGDVRLSPIDVEDIAKVSFRLLRDGGHGGERLDMTGPKALSMAEIAGHISAAVGRTIRYVNVDPAERRRALLAAGLPEYLVDAMDEQAAERRRRPESRVNLSAHQAFGVKPTTFADFARRHAAVFSGGTLAA
ncbi:SDR family oxidoreductase [Rhodoplanes sp. Z2-YC6860]|uniref:SDR family oxidoreductase n=1 Tax=Rhodoplanes sp. Z2-YC6860 TaxID=674703 RepID=UPI00082E30D8|nr:SDR family oxidoreductase [Rhodoplanes sp. Z2-YC6860]